MQLSAGTTPGSSDPVSAGPAPSPDLAPCGSSLQSPASSHGFELSQPNDNKKKIHL